MNGEPVVAEIARLWNGGRTAGEIAAVLILPEWLVLSVLQTGTLPETEPAWQPLPETENPSAAD